MFAVRVQSFIFLMNFASMPRMRIEIILSTGTWTCHSASATQEREREKERENTSQCQRFSTAACCCSLVMDATGRRRGTRAADRMQFLILSPASSRRRRHRVRRSVWL